MIRWIRYKLTGSPLNSREREFMNDYESRGTREDGSTRRSTMGESMRYMRLETIKIKYEDSD